MTEFAMRQLAAATVLQAAKDYFGKKSTPERRKAILKDLRSTWMDWLTNGTSRIVAEQLEKNPEEIKERLSKQKERLQ